MKVIITGGVAGGASCAARLRRLDEHAEIIMVQAPGRLLARRWPMGMPGLKMKIWKPSVSR